MVNDRQSLDLTTFARPPGGGDVEWRTSAKPVPYPDSVTEMEARVADIPAHKASELVWLLEHPPLYPSGTSRRAGHLHRPPLPTSESGRRGPLRYHRPGPRAAHRVLDRERRAPAVA